MFLSRSRAVRSFEARGPEPLGDDEALARLLERDAALASEPGDLYDWDPLTYLCFSKYLRFDRARAEAFVRAARTCARSMRAVDTKVIGRPFAPTSSQAM